MADIRHSILIDAPAQRVYPLISSAHGFSQCWAADAATHTSSGAVELGFFNRATLYRLDPGRMSPPLEAEWACVTGQEWSGTRLLFRLEARGAQTLLRFTHADWAADTDYFVSCTTTWGELMFRLKSAAEGKSRGPLFLAASLAY
jgi:uncharacterized protein YndB with AHSA1/START domain